MPIFHRHLHLRVGRGDQRAKGLSFGDAESVIMPVYNIDAAYLTSRLAVSGLPGYRTRLYLLY